MQRIHAVVGLLCTAIAVGVVSWGGGESDAS
jgi:hypothetical protein